MIKIKLCPRCLKYEFDVTGKGIPPNPYYKCWNCGFECYSNQINKFANFDKLTEKTESKPIKDRTDKEHTFLIRWKYNGSVRDYLLSMGEFKEDKNQGD